MGLRKKSKNVKNSEAEDRCKIMPDVPRSEL